MINILEKLKDSDISREEIEKHITNRNCGVCKHYTVMYYDKPCVDCIDHVSVKKSRHHLWEPHPDFFLRDSPYQLSTQSFPYVEPSKEDLLLARLEQLEAEVNNLKELIKGFNNGI